jgi:hypothetical protein
MEDAVTAFDWHSDPITRKTPITASYRNSQNVRRFFQSQCGARFKFDRPFMAPPKFRVPCCRLRLFCDCGMELA